jgi:hypothetical protein
LPHHFSKPGGSERLLQLTDIVEGAEIHGLCDNAIFRVTLAAHRLPPQIFALKLGNEVPRSIGASVCRGI